MSEAANDTKMRVTAFPKAAAKLVLEKILAGKGKGDHITKAEIESCGMPINSMRSAVIRIVRHRGLTPIAVPGDGYRISTDNENNDIVRRRTEGEARAVRETLRVHQSTDVSKLDEQQLRRHEWQGPRVAMRAVNVTKDVKDTRQEFKLTERVPLRVITDGK